MNKRPEPDDVELVVGEVEPDAKAWIETARFIEAYKNRPDYRLEVEVAERILAALGIQARDDGIRDAQSLLEHWRGCVAELLNGDSRTTNGTGGDAEGLGASPGFPREKEN